MTQDATCNYPLQSSSLTIRTLFETACDYWKMTNVLVTRLVNLNHLVSLICFPNYRYLSFCVNFNDQLRNRKEFTFLELCSLSKRKQILEPFKVFFFTPNSFMDMSFAKISNIITIV